MKLKQIVCDKSTLTLTKEKKVIEYGNVFEVDDERGNEILNATYKGKPVAEVVKEDKKNTADKTAEKTLEETKQEPKKENKKQETK